jgi:hypothetical protein
MTSGSALQLVTESPPQEGTGPSQGFLRFLLSELRPRGRLLTPFNIISAPIILLAIGVIVWRFVGGLGAVTHAAQDTPWGLWIGFNVVTGVAFAGGAYVITFMVYILHAETYRPIVRSTVLYGFLAYVFYAGALALDVGRPWKMINPIIGNCSSSPGISSSTWRPRPSSSRQPSPSGSACGAPARCFTGSRWER